MATIICQLCGKTAQRKVTAKWCSNACKSANWRKQKKEAHQKALQLRIQISSGINALVNAAIEGNAVALESLHKLKDHFELAEKRYIARGHIPIERFHKILEPGFGIVELTHEEYLQWSSNHKTIDEAKEFVRQREAIGRLGEP